MAWTRRWYIDSTAKLGRVLMGLAHLQVPSGAPLELVVRPWRREKTDAQRAYWHALMAEIAPQMGLTPAEMKLLVKRLYFGIEMKMVRLVGREVPVEVVPSSEDLDLKGYGEVIDFTIRLAAEEGIQVVDRRPR